MQSKLLIPANERSYFIILFTVLTAIVWVFRIDVSRRINLTQTSFEDGLIWGLMMGTFQWLVLRKYISSKHWISSTAMGLAITIQFPSIILRFNSIPYFGLFTIAAPLWLGFSQWLFLRRYVQYSWVWIIVPVLSFEPIISIVNNLKIGSFDSRIIGGTIVGLVPAISFCLLQRKERQSQNFD